MTSTTNGGAVPAEPTYLHALPPIDDEPDDEPELRAEAEASASVDPYSAVAWNRLSREEQANAVRGAKSWRAGLQASVQGVGAGTPSQYLEMAGTVPPRRILAADELMARRFPELMVVVPGLLLAGLSLVVSAPKIGKSWLVLGLGIAVATGGRALGALPVQAGDVLILALEDTQRRLQARLATILDDGQQAPSRLYMATTWPRLDDGGLDELRAWLVEHPAARLVVVDTLAIVRSQKALRRDSGLYEEDYAALRGLKALADEFGVAIVVVHHTRKMAAIDPLDLVNGTHGLSGAADAVLVLQRERVKTDAKLHVMGRDVEEATHRLTWSPGAGTWAIIDPNIADASIERREVLEALARASGPRTPTEMATALNRPVGSIKRLMWEMSKANQLTGGGRGGYTLPTTYTEPNESGTMEPPEPSEPGEPRYGEGSFGSGVLRALGRTRAIAVDEKTDPPDVADVRPTAAVSVTCRDYARHQSAHRWADGAWICDLCTSEPVPWL